MDTQIIVSVSLDFAFYLPLKIKWLGRSFLTTLKLSSVNHRSIIVERETERVETPP